MKKFFVVILALIIALTACSKEPVKEESGVQSESASTSTESISESSKESSLPEESESEVQTEPFVRPTEAKGWEKFMFPEKLDEADTMVIENMTFVKIYPYLEGNSGPVSAYLQDSLGKLYFFDGFTNSLELLARNVCNFDVVWDYGSSERVLLIHFHTSDLIKYYPYTKNTEFVTSDIKAFSKEKSTVTLLVTGEYAGTEVMDIYGPTWEITRTDGIKTSNQKGYFAAEGTDIKYYTEGKWNETGLSGRIEAADWRIAAIIDGEENLWFYDYFDGEKIELGKNIYRCYLTPNDKIDYSSDLFYLDREGSFYIAEIDGMGSGLIRNEKLDSGVEFLSVSGRYYAVKKTDGSAYIKSVYNQPGEYVAEFEDVTDIYINGTCYAVCRKGGEVTLGQMPGRDALGQGEAMGIFDAHVVEKQLVHPQSGKPQPENPVDFAALSEAPEGYTEHDFGDFTLWANKDSLKACRGIEELVFKDNKILSVYGGEERIISEVEAIPLVEDESTIFIIEDKLYGTYEELRWHYFGGYRSNEYKFGQTGDWRFEYYIDTPKAVFKFTFNPVYGIGVGTQTDEFEELLRSFKLK